jgi:hypothetical protein
VKSRIVVSLLCVGALAFACSPRSHSSEAQRANEPSPRREPGTSLASSLRVSVERGVDLAYHVTNATDRRVEIRFPSGQTHDFVVLDSAQREVWRWSREHLFTQAVQTRLLDSGETVSFDERWDPAGRSGTYTAVATLNSDSHHLESRVEFSVP